MADSATLNPAYPLDNSMGAMMIGVIVSAVLHGITLLQAFIYSTNYKNDVWYLKCLVATTVCFDAIHLALISHAVYHYVVSSYHDPEALLRITWTVLIEALFTGVNAGIVQTFYTLRVFRLSKKNYWLSGGILFLILSTTGCGIAWVIISLQLDTYKELLRYTPLTITINALSTASDVIIAVSLCFLLHRARTGFKRSDSIINKLIIFIINTGVLTTCCAIASLICLVASPNSLIYATFYFCIGRLYTNSFLATLNARKSFRSAIDDSHAMLSMPQSALSPQASSGGKVQNISIRIEKSTSQDASQKISKGDTLNSGLSGKSPIPSEEDISIKKGGAF